MKPDMRKTTIYLPSELVDALKEKAKAERRSFNGEIIWLLQQGLKGNTDASAERP